MTGTRTHQRGLLRLALAAIAAVACLALAPTAQASFGFQKLGFTFTEQDPSSPGPLELATQAGSHPFAITTTIDLSVKTTGEGEVPDEEARELIASQPAGFVGDATAMPHCSTAEFLEILNFKNACPDRTAVGFVAFRNGAGVPEYNTAPVYSLPPSPGVPVTLGFTALTAPVVIQVRVNPNPPYNVVATAPSIPQVVRFFGSQLTLWGDPSDPVHDPYRGNCLKVTASPEPTFVSTGSCAANLPEKPFLTLPTNCSGPLEASFEADSWQQPERWVSGAATFLDDSEPPQAQKMTGCGKLGFNPTIEAQPTTRAAESSTGLDFSLNVHDEGLTNPTGLAQSDIRKAVVTLPEGMTANPSSAEGLGVCSEAQLGQETLESSSAEGCPEASKLGTVEVESPLVEEDIDGSLYIAKPYQNPFHTLLALYVVIKNPNLGIIVKQPLKVEPDPKSGRLITTAEEIPQLPFARFKLHFREGARSPLVSPPACGEYQTEAKLYPWSGGEPITTTSPFQIVSGTGESPCPPGGTPPFHPGFEAGSDNNAAGAYSPFYMRLTRRDGEQDMTRFSSVLPPGVVGKIAGVAKCPQADVEAAKLTSGLQQLSSPSCPAGSQIGRTMTGAGVGSVLTWVPGSLYLGGPYHGDPLSVVAIVPAVAGPFDVGTVVVQEALTLNPVTAEVEVDGSASDPIPHILAGIPLKVRDIRVYVDKPQFTLNPTSCEPSSTRAMLWGGGADVFSSADDVPIALASRFQAAGCANLGFKPKLAIKLKGGTRRGNFPALNAIVTPRAGDANFGDAVVTLPHSAFLEQGHFGTICTRVQFAAGAGNGAQCPEASIYGKARAWSPLLEEALEGPVYLRSSNHNLPDLVVALHGIVNVDLDARIDSLHGGIRSSFEGIPDAPVSRFVLEMQGGKKGLIVNSTDICEGKHPASADLTGQNGRRDDFKSLVRSTSCQKKHKRKHRAHGKGKGRH